MSIRIRWYDIVIGVPVMFLIALFYALIVMGAVANLPRSKNEKDP